MYVCISLCLMISLDTSAQQIQFYGALKFMKLQIAFDSLTRAASFMYIFSRKNLIIAFCVTCYVDGNNVRTSNDLSSRRGEHASELFHHIPLS